MEIINNIILKFDLRIVVIFLSYMFLFVDEY